MKVLIDPPRLSSQQMEKESQEGTSALNHVVPEVITVMLLTFYWQALVT